MDFVCNIHQKNIVCISIYKETNVYCEKCLVSKLNDLKINSNKLIHIDDLSENILDDISVKYKSFEDFQSQWYPQQLKEQLQNQIKSINQQHKEFIQEISKFMQNFYNDQLSYDQIAPDYHLFHGYFSEQIHQTMLKSSNLQQFKDRVGDLKKQLNENITYKTLIQQLESYHKQMIDIPTSLAAELKIFSSKHTNLLKQFSKFVRQKLNIQTLEIYRSKVDYPDAYNEIFYSEQLIKNGINELKIIIKETPVLKCHFFVGILEESLKDEQGYNHEQPCVCLICEGHQLKLEDSIQLQFKVNGQNSKSKIFLIFLGQKKIYSHEYNDDNEYRFFINTTQAFSHQYIYQINK